MSLIDILSLLNIISDPRMEYVLKILSIIEFNRIIVRELSYTLYLFNKIYITGIIIWLSYSQLIFSGIIIGQLANILEHINESGVI